MGKESPLHFGGIMLGLNLLENNRYLTKNPSNVLSYGQQFNVLTSQRLKISVERFALLFIETIFIISKKI